MIAPIEDLDDEKRRIRPKTDADSSRYQFAKSALAEGSPISQVAKFLNVHPDSIRRWRRNKFKEPSGKKSKAKTWKGRPRLNAQQRYRLLKTLREHPDPLDIRGFKETMRYRCGYSFFRNNSTNTRLRIWTTSNIAWLIHQRYPGSAEATWRTESLRLWLKEQGYRYCPVRGWCECLVRKSKRVRKRGNPLIASQPKTAHGGPKRILDIEGESLS